MGFFAGLAQAGSNIAHGASQAGYAAMEQQLGGIMEKLKASGVMDGGGKSSGFAAGYASFASEKGLGELAAPSAKATPALDAIMGWGKQASGMGMMS